MSDRKNIGIDVDDTLLYCWEQGLFDLYNEKHNRNLVLDDIKAHNFNGDEKLRDIFFEYFEKNWEKLELFAGAKETIEKLATKHDLYIVTSRPARDKEKTISYLENIFGKDTFKEYLFTSDKGTSDKKCEIANEYDFDIVIDDAAHHIGRYLENTDARVFIFSQPWNRDGVFQGATRVKNWEDFGEQIENI